jgi:drug/metabolite transporter (DMT)-like permease
MAVALALIASLCWGVADFMGGSLSRRHPLLVVVLVSQAVGLAGVVVVAAARSGGYDTGAALPGVLAGLAGVVAVSSFYRSMTLGAISVAAPILATSAVVPVVVGLATGERPSAVQLVGIGAALAGNCVGVTRALGREAPSGAPVTLALVAARRWGCSWSRSITPPRRSAVGRCHGATHLGHRVRRRGPRRAAGVRAPRCPPLALWGCWMSPPTRIR